MLKKRSKIFCIGSGKTGTTSLEKALKDLGYKLGDQAKGELLIEAYAKRDFKTIVKFCRSAEAFQDVPFCFKYTYMALDLAYPHAKFILTIRDSDEQWLNSLKTFHSKRFADGKRVPTVEDLKNATYRYKGHVWNVRQKVYGITEEDDPYDETILKAYYNDHNASIIDYFRYRDNLLVLNVSHKDAYMKLCDFLGKKPLYETFPWENKTSDIK